SVGYRRGAAERRPLVCSSSCLGRLGRQEERLERVPDTVDRRLVEALVGARHRDRVAYDAGAGDPEDAAQVLLRPEGAELSLAGADDRDRPVEEGSVPLRARGPVDGVLQAAGDGAVVLRRG